MIGTILLILTGISIIVVLTLGAILCWALAENRGEDRRGPFLELVRKWVTKRPAKLDYRRDEKGRFRKVRRR